MSNTVASGRISGFKFRSRGELTGGDTFPGRMDSVGDSTADSVELGVRAKTTVDLHQGEA